MNNLESAPADFRYPNSGARDPNDSDEEPGDESVVDFEDEDSDIGRLRFYLKNIKKILKNSKNFN